MAGKGKKTQTASLVPFKCPFGFGEKQNEILMVMLRFQKPDENDIQSEGWSCDQTVEKLNQIKICCD